MLLILKNGMTKEGQVKSRPIYAWKPQYIAGKPVLCFDGLFRVSPDVEVALVLSKAVESRQAPSTAFYLCLFGENQVGYIREDYVSEILC